MKKLLLILGVVGLLALVAKFMWDEA